MGVQEVTIYTCDGCGATATLKRGTSARGWHTIKLDAVLAGIGGKVLCSVCYGAVEWVTKFQGITTPPKVYKSRSGKQWLRKDPGESLQSTEEENIS